MLDRFLEHGSPIRLSRGSPIPGCSGLASSPPVRKRGPHKIRFARRGETAIREYAPEDFQRAAGHVYLPELEFEDEKTFRRIRTQCEKALKKNAIEKEMKWLGAFHAEQIRNHFVADVSIRWIDERIGYGLFADVDTVAGEYIGEYAGVVRRRNLIFRNYNDYCFSYPTSDLNFRKHVIDAQEKGNELRYANHSELPNCEARGVWLDGILHIILRARKDIPAHTQITYDYSRQYWQTRTPVPNLTE